MFSLFKDNAQFQFDLLGQKKPYEDVYDYIGITVTGSSICLYIIDEIGETKVISNMSDIVLNVSDYLLEYYRDGRMVILNNVRFLEMDDDCCCIESANNGLVRAYLIRPIITDIEGGIMPLILKPIE